MTLRVGIIGTGRHGSRYADHIVNDLDSLHLTAIARRSEEGWTQAEQWDAAYYGDWSDLIRASDVDAVIAVTTPNLNLAIARQCSAVNKPLLVEKPLSINGKDAASMLAVTRNIPLTVGQTLRFNPIINGLKKHLPDIGSVHSFHASQRLEKTLHSWLDIPEIAGAGVILHTAIHMFDALRYITGQNVKRVRAVRFCRHNQCLEDLFMALMEMENGMVGTVDASKVGLARSGRYEFVGDRGQLQGDQVHNVLERIEGMNITSLDTDSVSPAIVPLLRQWAAFLKGKGANPVCGEDGLAAVKIADACLFSAHEDRWVDLY